MEISFTYEKANRNDDVDVSVTDNGIWLKVPGVEFTTFLSSYELHQLAVKASRVVASDRISA